MGLFNISLIYVQSCGKRQRKQIIWQKMLPIFTFLLLVFKSTLINQIWWIFFFVKIEILTIWRLLQCIFLYLLNKMWFSAQLGYQNSESSFSLYCSSLSCCLRHSSKTDAVRFLRGGGKMEASQCWMNIAVMFKPEIHIVGRHGSCPCIS